MGSSEQSPVRIAMVGAGGMANAVHYPSLNSFDDVEIVALCDLDTDRMQATADTYQIEKQYTDYKKMVEDVAPDAIYVIGQPNIMYPIWSWCLTEGQNLYIEKPMGLSVHQGRSLAHLAEKYNCITQVSYQRRSCPMVVKLHEECLKRGPIVHAVSTFYKHGPSPFLGAVDHMFDDSVHAIDTLRWMCGGDVVNIQSHTGRIGVPDINLITAIVEFDSGATGILLNSWASGRRIFSVEMHAQGICAHAEHESKGHLYVDADTEGITFDTKDVAGSDENYVYGGFQAKNREFIDCIKAGTQPGSNFSDAVKTIEVADTILAQSLLKGI